MSSENTSVWIMLTVVARQALNLIPPANFTPSLSLTCNRFLRGTKALMYFFFNTPTCVSVLAVSIHGLN